ncbi:MAG: hypothetical protein Q8P02_05260 [Candidatus Micrarchaeota archaeon]|nr:hypothetical protein [Candidatus Micrarchaeota archaeon]
MQKADYTVEFSGRATFRAKERGVPKDVMESVIQAGQFHRFAKNMVKISRNCGGKIVTCVGQIRGIRIITVTVRRGKKQ